MYAATEDNGVYRSTNNGLDWNAFNRGLEGIPGAKNVRTVFTSGATVYAGTSRGPVQVGRRRRVPARRAGP